METFNQKFSGYYEYFESIRKRVFKIAVVFGVFFVVGFLGAGHILKAIMGLFNLDSATIVTTSPFQFLDLSTKVGMYLGIIVCLPMLVYYLYDFLKDGLNRNEKKLFFVLLPIGVVLFATGFVYSYIILHFYLGSVSMVNNSFGIQNIWDISSFLSQIIMASIFLGLIFQFPIVLTFLIRVGMLKVETLRSKRFYAFASMFIFVGFLPPPDIFSTIFQVIPLIVIYQFTIWANAPYGARMARAEKLDRSSLKSADRIVVPILDNMKTAT